jgi:uncharacterized protein
VLHPLRHPLTVEKRMKGLVIDTNVFVAAGFNPRSASALILAKIRERRLQLVWNEPTRRETEMVLRRIPRLNWDKFADLFRPKGEFIGPVHPEVFMVITDPDDRKFAALSAAANRPLITSDNHLLSQRNTVGVKILTPAEFLARTKKEGD